MDIAIIILLVVGIFTAITLKIRNCEMGLNFPVLAALILFIIKIS